MVSKECTQDSCTFSRVINSQKEEIVTLSNDRLSDVKKLDSDLYYFHLSCGNPCGYGHYVTVDDVFVTQDNEILVDKQKKCIVYADWTQKKLYSHNLNYPSSQIKLLYDFETDYRYINDIEDMQELLSLKDLDELFKEDAVIDDNGTLHLYLLGKHQNILDLEIENACEASNELQ